jgi:hypothetical protein
VAADPVAIAQHRGPRMKILSPVFQCLFIQIILSKGRAGS